MVNFNPFNTQQTEKQGCSKYSRICTCGHLYYLKAHLNLLLWNHWTDFNQTCQKCSFDGPLLDLCFADLLIWNPTWLPGSIMCSQERINPMVDNVTNSNNKYTPMVNFNPVKVICAKNAKISIKECKRQSNIKLLISKHVEAS
jgi:hypothetical protein